MSKRVDKLKLFGYVAEYIRHDGTKDYSHGTIKAMTEWGVEVFVTGLLSGHKEIVYITTWEEEEEGHQSNVVVLTPNGRLDFYGDKKEETTTTAPSASAEKSLVRTRFSEMDAFTVLKVTPGCGRGYNPKWTPQPFYNVVPRGK